MEKKLIVKEDMICPISNRHCDDECCTVGTECNLSGRQSITSYNKQTAVQWLSNHWTKLQKDGEKMSWQQIIDITNLALQMEREQMLEASISGSMGKSFEEFYQTFKTLNHVKIFI